MELSKIDKILFREAMKPVVNKKLNKFMNFDGEDNTVKDIRFANGSLTDGRY